MACLWLLAVCVMMMIIMVIRLLLPVLFCVSLKLRTRLLLVILMTKLYTNDTLKSGNTSTTGHFASLTHDGPKPLHYFYIGSDSYTTNI